MYFVNCKECGKEMHAYKYNLTDYGYKIGNKYFCCWQCLRKYEKSREKERMRVMKWGRENDTTIMAEGNNGTFRITKQGGMYCGRYHGKDNRHFKLPEKRLVNDAKVLCESNFYWEKEQEKEQ